MKNSFEYLNAPPANVDRACCANCQFWWSDDESANDCDLGDHRLSDENFIVRKKWVTWSDVIHASELLDGKCLRMPPNILMNGKFVQPATNVIDWCGEWKLRTRDLIEHQIETAETLSTAVSFDLPIFQSRYRIKKNPEFCKAVCKARDAFEGQHSPTETIAKHYGVSTRHITTCVIKGRLLLAQDAVNKACGAAA